MYELAADNPPLEAQVNIHDTKGQTVVGSGCTNETHIRPGEARKWNEMIRHGGTRFTYSTSVRGCKLE